MPGLSVYVSFHDVHDAQKWMLHVLPPWEGSTTLHERNDAVKLAIIKAHLIFGIDGSSSAIQLTQGRLQIFTWRDLQAQQSACYTGRYVTDECVSLHAYRHDRS